MLTEIEKLYPEGENYTSREIREMLDPSSPAFSSLVCLFSLVSPSSISNTHERKLRMLAILRCQQQTREGGGEVPHDSFSLWWYQPTSLI